MSRPSRGWRLVVPKIDAISEEDRGTGWKLRGGGGDEKVAG